MRSVYLVGCVTSQVAGSPLPFLASTVHVWCVHSSLQHELPFATINGVKYVVKDSCHVTHRIEGTGHTTQYAPIGGSVLHLGGVRQLIDQQSYHHAYVDFVRRLPKTDKLIATRRT